MERNLPPDSPAPGPFTLAPILLKKPWGGNRLSRFPGKQVLPGSRIGESWETGDENTISSGPMTGCRLGDAVRVLGDRLCGGGLASRGFPLLLKLIDARERLSLQVHPGERLREPVAGRGSEPPIVDRPGKAEAWFVLEGGELILGLEPGADRRVLEESLGRKLDLSGILRMVTVKPGDSVAVPPGTLHAIGAGVMLAEVQQPNDVTYRVHDWGRRGRELHLRQALEVLDPDSRPVPWPSALEWSESGNTHRFHLGCRHFAMETAVLKETAAWRRRTGNVELALVLEGRLRLGLRGRDASETLGPGQTAVVPAAAPEVWMEPLEPTTLFICHPCRGEDELVAWLGTRGIGREEARDRFFQG